LLMDKFVSQDLSRRRLLVSAAAGVAGLSLIDIPTAMAAPSPTTLPEVLSGDAGSMQFVNYATYVQDRSIVDASRAEHQLYADAIREHDRLVIGGPLLGSDGRPRGVLLIYQASSKQQAETLVRSDPFVLKGAIAEHRLAEWSVVGSNVELLAAALVPADL